MKTIQDWIKEYPLIGEIAAVKEVFWANPKMEPFESGVKKIPLNENDIKDAEATLMCKMVDRDPPAEAKGS